MFSFAGSQNLILYSEQFDQGSWTKNNLSVTSNQGVAPNGTTTADKIIMPNNSSGKALYQSFTVSAYPTQITISVFAKSSGYNYVVMTMAYFGIRYSVTFDLTNGTVTKTASLSGPTSTAYSIVPVGDGWYRVSISMDAGGTTSWVACPSPVSVPTQEASFLDVTNAGNGTDGVLLWGAQTNYGYATTDVYQVTTSSASGGGFVTKWYDQSGNNRDSVQTTSNNQPRILFDYSYSGVLDNNAISFDGVDDKLITTYDISSPFSLFNVQRIASLPNNTNGSAFIGNLQNGGTYDGFSNGLSINNNYNIASSLRVGGIGYNTTYVTVNRDKALQSTFVNSNSLSSYVNGGTVSTINNSYASHDSQITMGGARSAETSPYMRAYYGYEVIFFSGSQSNNRITIQNNINNYYTIY